MKNKKTLKDMKKIQKTDDISQYEKFIGLMRGKLRNISPDKCILIISGKIKEFKYGTESVSVKERKEIIKFYKGTLVKEKNIISVTRTYGDEFIIAENIENMEEQAFLSGFNQVLYNFCEKIKESFPDVSVNIFLGLAIIKESGHDIITELDNANYARQEAEKKMRNVVIFHKEMLEERLTKVRFVNEFERALLRGEFKVYYQPKVDSLSHKVVGGEALVRWVKDDGTIIPPAAFIELFENNGYIVKLDYFVYDQVFKYIAERLEADEHIVPISMNVSRVHMENDDIADYIKSLIKKYKVSPEYLEFEITEDVCMLQMENTIKFIGEMKKLGIKISMDDFGSGYSSLNLLSEVPVDILKVDREFFKNWDKSPKKQIIVDSILFMAKKLHIPVVCEGIEYWEQSRYLGLAGCEMLQGFYFSKPVSEQEFSEYITIHKFVKHNVYIFKFDENLSDDSGVYEGKITGEKVKLVSGMANGRNVLYFPGDEPGREVLEMPKISYMNNDFSISMWIKSQRSNIWTSVFYAEYENVFLSIMPLGRDEKAVFRIKVNSEQEGWYDIVSTEVLNNEWTHLVASYNSSAKATSFYINGILARSIGITEKPEVLNRIMVGGDIYQRSFQGYIGEMRIYNYAMDIKSISEIYDSQRKIYE